MCERERKGERGHRDGPAASVEREWNQGPLGATEAVLESERVYRDGLCRHMYVNYNVVSIASLSA